MSDPFVTAREEACNKLGFMRSVMVETQTRKWEVPNPSLLDYKQQKRVNALDLWVQTTKELDRYKDTKDANGNVIKGAPKVPWRTPDGVLIEDDYDARLVKALFGDDQFDAFIEDGGNPSDISLFWTQMQKHMADRAKQDSKSGSGVKHLAAVPDAD